MIPRKTMFHNTINEQHQMNILLIEDDQRVADIIRRGLGDHGHSVTVETNGINGRDSALTKDYDIIISDILLPDISGVEICKHIKEQKPHLPILILTAFGTIDDKLQGFDAGADDYMVKPFDIRELHIRLNNLIKRTAIHQPQQTAVTYADLTIDFKTKTAYRSEVPLTLTPKEFKLLSYMVMNPERVLTRSELAAKVWDTHFDRGTNFIDVYINYLRKKVDRDFSVKLIHTRPGMGFYLKSE